MWETWVWSLVREDPLEKEMATHSSTLAWKTPRREEPGRLQSMGLQRVGHDWVTSPIFGDMYMEGREDRTGQREVRLPCGCNWDLTWSVESPAIKMALGNSHKLRQRGWTWNLVQAGINCECLLERGVPGQGSFLRLRAVPCEGLSCEWSVIDTACNGQIAASILMKWTDLSSTLCTRVVEREKEGGVESRHWVSYLIHIDSVFILLYVGLFPK